MNGRNDPGMWSGARWSLAAMLLTASLALAANGGAGSPAMPAALSPFTVAGPANALGVTRLRWQDQAYQELKAAAEVSMRLPLAPGNVVTLDLQPFDPFAVDAVLTAQTPAGEVRLARPDVLILRGTVSGQADSHAFLSLSPWGSNGLITTEGRTFVLSATSPGKSTESAIYELTPLTDAAINAAPWTCHADEILQPMLPVIDDNPDASRGEPPCRVAQVAIETDYEYLHNLFADNSAAAIAYIVTLVGAVSDVYERDFNVHLRLVYSNLWMNPSDPWNQTDTTNQLFQFRDYWLANRGNVQRHDAHFLSGRGLGGGVAWLPGLCRNGVNYALSANLGGFFPLPLQNNRSQNWDPYVVAHEFGHNFGAPHTHEMTPPIDQCASGQCQGASNGTIMSYCHLCAGGVANIRMEFHARTINETVLPYLNTTSCDLTGEPECLTMFTLPNSYTVFRGNANDGGLGELFDSDDDYLVVDAGLTLLPAEPPVWVELETVSPTLTPASLSFILEARVNTPNRVQTLSLFNYDTNSFEVIDTQTGSATDLSIEIAVTGDPGRFVGASGTMRAKMTWGGGGVVLLFPWTVSIDQAVWRVQ